MTDHIPFLRAIAEQDDDDPGPHLIYADFLDERGDPRGELIRLQLALETLDTSEPGSSAQKLKRREGELLRLHSRSWLEPLQPFGGGIELRRGLPDSITIEAKAFQNRAGELFDLAPIRHVRLLDVGMRLPTILADPRVKYVRTITIFAQYLRQRVAQAFVDCAPLPGLRSLDLSRNSLEDSGATILGCSRSLLGLRRLVLSENDIRDGGLRSIRATAFPRLEDLELYDNRGTLDGLEQLLSPECMPELKRVGMGRNRVGETRVYPGRNLHQPRYDGTDGRIDRIVDLSENRIGPEVGELLANSRYFARVRSIDLRHNDLTDETLHAMIQGSWLGQLRGLNLGVNRIGDIGIIEMAAHPVPFALESLDLSLSAVTDAGVRAILHSHNFPHLERLRIAIAGLSEPMYRLFREQYPILDGNFWFIPRSAL